MSDLPVIPQATSNTAQWIRQAATTVNALIARVGEIVAGDLIGPQATITSSATSYLFIRPSGLFGNIADGTSLYFGSPDFTTPKNGEILVKQLLIEPSEKITVNPTALSYAQGLVVNQSSPSSGTKAGPFDFNSVDVNIRATATGTGLPGEAGNAAWNVLRVTGYVGGSNFGADQTSGIAAGIIVNQASTSTSDQTAMNGGVFVDNVSYGGNLYGGCSAATVRGSSGSARQVMGHEFGVSIRENGSSPWRSAINLANYGDKVATDIDAAVTVGCAGPTGFASGSFKNLIYFVDPTPGVAMPGDPLSESRRPLATTANFFKSNVAFTVANIFDLANVTVTGNILNFPNAKLTGAGHFTWKPSSSATPANNGELTVEATSNTSLTFKFKGSDGVVRTASLTLT